MSPNGKTLAVGHDEFRVVFRDLATGRPLLGSLNFPGTSMDTLRFTADGKTLITAGRIVDAVDAGSVLIWDVASDAKPFSIHVVTRGPVALDVSPDGKTLATADQKSARLWDVDKRSELRRLPRASPASVVCFAPDGKTLASAEDSVLRLWDVATGTERRAVAGVISRSLAFSPGGKVLASAEGFDIVLRDANTGEVVRRLAGHRETVDTIAFSPDGKTLVSGGHDHAVRIWDLATGKQKLHGDEPCASAVAAHFTPDGKHVVIGTRDHWVRVWDAQTGTLVRRIGRDDYLTTLSRLQAAAVSPDGRLVATAHDGDCALCLWDLSSGRELRRFKVDGHLATSLAFTPDGKEMLSAGYGDKVMRWTAETGALRRTYGGFGSQGFFSLSRSHDGSLLALAGQDRVYHLIDADGSERSAIRPDPNAFPGPAALSPDGRLLAIYSSHQIGVWEVASGMLFLAHGPADPTPSMLTFSPDGRRLIWAEQRNVRAVDLLTEEIRAIEEAHETRVGCVEFAPDGRRLLTAADDGTALIWDAACFRPVPSAKGEIDPKFPRAWDYLLRIDQTHDARRAMASMVAEPNTFVPFLSERLRPVPDVDRDRIRRLIRDLDNDEFETRERASTELARVVDAAEVELRAAVRESPSAEVRRRATLALEGVQRWQYPMSGEALRTVRAIEVLERIATPEARKLLRDLAGGAPGARQTREAAAALKRLEGA
jgi:WD40 repeat protein